MAQYKRGDRQVMKKLKALLGVITCVFALTACGGASNPARIQGETLDQQTESMLIQSGEQAVSYMQQIDAAGGIEQYKDDEILFPALESWHSSAEDIGTVNGFTNEYAVQTADDEYTINIGIDGTDHDANVVIVASSDGQQLKTDSITTNVNYSLGELMEQAGLNTVLGMGTTFIVLIILMALISLFRYIPKLQAAFAKKPEEEAAPAPAPAAAAAVPAAQTTDDNELIAVIAAAVAASEGAVTTDGYVVRSIRKSRKKGF